MSGDVSKTTPDVVERGWNLMTGTPMAEPKATAGEAAGWPCEAKPDCFFPDCDCLDGKLLACPFCGSAPAFGMCDGGEDDPNHGGKFIECSNCHVSTPLIFPVMDDVSGPLSDIWNRRVKS